MSTAIKLGGDGLPVYGIVVFSIGFFVHFLLLMGVNQLFQTQSSFLRLVIAAMLSGAYGSLCLLPGTQILGNSVLWLLWLLLISAIGFGSSPEGIRQSAVYVALSLASSSVSQGKQMDERSLLTASILVLIFFITGTPRFLRNQNYVPVELTYGKTNIQLMALRDTGNHLRDPVTGKPVLVVSADAAQKLTGLSLQQLRCPVDAVGAIPGLRLIPYKVVGGSGLLLALRIPKVKIGTWQGSSVVAFAPDVLNANGQYQALTGGML